MYPGDVSTFCKPPPKETSMRRKRSSLAWSRPVAKIMLGLFLLASAGLVMPGDSGEGMKYGVGSWDPESGLGNHRAIVRVEASPPAKAAPTKRRVKKPAEVTAVSRPGAARLTIPWRRRDLEPDKKNILVLDAATGERITNVLPLMVTRESGDILFEPKTGPGDHFVFFRPS